MNHISKIAEKLEDYGLDAMLVTSESGELYALGFHGEGLLLITKDGGHYSTDGRYIEAAQEQVTGVEVKCIGGEFTHLNLARTFIEANNLHNVGFESSAMTVDEHRRYAQELMRLIHKNEFCRDIAIWYDEYLTPGEDFNQEIAAALEGREYLPYGI